MTHLFAIELDARLDLDPMCAIRIPAAGRIFLRTCPRLARFTFVLARAESASCSARLDAEAAAGDRGAAGPYL